jgi:hypothetical protein
MAPLEKLGFSPKDVTCVREFSGVLIFPFFSLTLSRNLID